MNMPRRAVLILSLSIIAGCLPGEASERIDALESSDGGIEGDLGDLQRQLNKAQAAIERLEGLDPENQIARIEALETKTDDAATWASGVDEQLDASSSADEEHNIALAGHNTALAGHDTALAGHDTALAGHDTALAGHDDTLAAHSVTLDDIAGTLGEYAITLSKHTVALADELTARKAADSTLTATASSLNVRAGALEDDVDDLNGRAEDIEDDIDELMVYASETTLTTSGSERLSTGRASARRRMTFTKQLADSKLVIRYSDDARSFYDSRQCGLEVRVGTTVCATHWVVTDAKYSTFTLQAECPGKFAAGKHIVSVHASPRTLYGCYLGYPGYAAKAQLTVRETL